MKKFIILFVLACTLLINCSKRTSENINPVSDFPNSIGNKYTYRVTDSIRHTTYNVIVSVIGKTKMLNGEPVTMWSYTYPSGTYPSGIDTNYVFTNKDSVVFYGNRQSDITQQYITNLYHFPLTVGAKWRVSFIGDTSTVISNINISAVNKTYNNAFLIHESGYSYNYRITRDQWFVPNLGLVKMDYKTLGVLQIWELISYDLK